MQLARPTQTESELFRLIEEVTVEIGFRHFALINHVDLKGRHIMSFAYTIIRQLGQRVLYRTDYMHMIPCFLRAWPAWSDLLGQIYLR